MLLRLKVPVHYIKARPPQVAETRPDHNFHILMAVVGLNHLFLLFLGWRTETPLCSFTPPPLYRTLITPYVPAPLLPGYTSMPKAPFEPPSCMSICEERAARSFPISDTMAFKDGLDYGPPAIEVEGRNTYSIRILLVFADVT
jgi:hypothetical protein